MSYDAEVEADGPLSYWKLDAIGTYLGGPALLDSVGSLHFTNLALSGPPSFVAGLDGLVMALGENENIRLPENPSPALLTFPNHDPFSDEVWFRAAIGSLGCGSALLSWEDYGDGFHLGVVSWADGMEAAFSRESPTTEQLVSTYPDTPLSYDAWHHVVGTYDGVTLRLYLDGVMYGENGVNMVMGVDAAADFIDVSVCSDFLVGRLAIYDHALSPERIAAHYAAGIAVPAATARAGLIHARRDGHGIGS